MIIIFLGPQGSGKGTQGKLLAEAFDLKYVSTGDVLREEAKGNKKLAAALEAGELLSDEVVVSSLQKYLTSNNIKDNLVLDGIPRRISQYELLKKIFGVVDIVILIKISREESIRRLSARRQDPKTGKIYNLETLPKPPADIISRLIQREDDKPEAINKRLREYEIETAPLISQLQKEGILIGVDGERSIEAINKDLIEIVERKKVEKN